MALSCSQKWVTGALVLGLVMSRLAVAWPDMSTRTLWVPTDGRTLSGDAITYDMPAYNLLAGNGYSNCLAPPYEPSVMRTPTYPLVLAATYATFGRNAAAVIAVNVVFDVAAALLLFAVALRKLPSWWAIAFLGATVLLAPWSFFIGMRLSEPIAALLLAATLWLSLGPPSPGRWLALGLCLGALLLCRPVFFLLPVVIVLWAVTLGRSRLEGRGAWILAALFAGVLAMWTPWVARNAVSVDRFIPLTAAGSGLSLWLGTWYDGGSYWTTKRTAGRRLERTLPDRAFASAEERERVVPQFERWIELYFSNAGMKMVEPDRALREIALEKIRAEPLDWLKVRLRGTARMLKQRFFVLRLVKSKTPWSVATWIVSALALVGAFVTVWRRSWQPVTLIFLYTWLIHFPSHTEARYLAPAYGAAMLLAFLALYELVTALAASKGGGAICQAMKPAKTIAK
jgi:hypothetical protein